ncbi:MAG: hypothetical protein ABIJ21_05220, partial [Nanoarchaeota archaeon]
MKHGQYALEVLTTYGWVLVVVMTIFGTLWSFGIINPKFLKSDSCWFDSGITCKEAAIQGDFIVLVLVNGFRQDITPK